MPFTDTIHATAGAPVEAPQPLPKATKIGFVSLGCPKNLVDTEVMMGLLQSNGGELVSDVATADVIVVNTCAFIHSAKEESVNAILEMTQHKNSADGQKKKVIVAGCLVERFRNEIQKNIPEVDGVLGTGELDQVIRLAGLGGSRQNLAASPFTILTSRPEAIARDIQGRFSRDTWDGAIADLPNYLMDEHTPRVLATPRASAYLKIAEGCDHPCGFCIIPQLRGKFRSRPLRSVIAEAARLVASGVREITLIGQDTTCYGEDLYDSNPGDRADLVLLLDRLARLDSLQWIRFLYAYPNKISDRLLHTIASNPNICNYLDLPLQHASPAVLKRMKRGGGADLFLRSIDNMRKVIPDLVLRTSFIVGFPGETETDFELLCDFVREARFDWMGVFTYSDEEGSHAISLDGKVSASEARRRKNELMRIQNKISKMKQKAFVGREFDVLVNGPSAETDLLWEGRSERHAPEIDGKILINDFGSLATLVPGEFYRCLITASTDYDLVGRIL